MSIHVSILSFIVSGTRGRGGGGGGGELVWSLFSTHDFGDMLSLDVVKL